MKGKTTDFFNLGGTLLLYGVITYNKACNRFLYPIEPRQDYLEFLFHDTFPLSIKLLHTYWSLHFFFNIISILLYAIFVLCQ